MAFILEFFRSLPFNARMVLIAIIGALLILGVVLGKSCYNNWRFEGVKQEFNEGQANIDAGQVNANVAEQGKDEAVKGAHTASNGTQKASEEFNASKHTDSSKLPNTNASKRFCEKFPEDSTCKSK